MQESKIYVVYKTECNDYGDWDEILLCTYDKQISDKLNGFKEYRVQEFIENNSTLEELTCENNLLKAQLRNALLDRETFERNYINTRRMLDKLEAKIKEGE